MKEIAKKAFRELFPEKKLPSIDVTFSNNFKPYNANIRYAYSLSYFEFRLSKRWKLVSEDILLGLFQNLILKVYKEKKNTLNIDLYEHFTRNLHIAAPKKRPEPELLESFSKLNEKYFYGTLEIPNLKWGKESRTTLGHYNYKNDTITISSIFKKIPCEFLDYIMYHEMLHKKHKFYKKNGRNFHHTKQFKQDEKKFENYDQIQKQMKKILARKIIMTTLKEFFTA